VGVGPRVLVATRVVRLGGSRPGRVLKLSGVGFKSFVTPGGLTLGLGYSHYVGVLLPGGVALRPGRGHLAVGPHVGDLTGRIRRLRLPDPYKSRGIYPTGEVPPRKEGKRR
jgi:large subunit ribosomal protein L6